MWREGFWEGSIFRLKSQKQKNKPTITFIFNKHTTGDLAPRRVQAYVIGGASRRCLQKELQLRWWSYNVWDINRYLFSGAVTGKPCPFRFTDLAVAGYDELSLFLPSSLAPSLDPCLDAALFSL